MGNNLAKLINEAVDKAFSDSKRNKVRITGDELGRKCYIALSANAQKGFSSELFTIDEERGEIFFKKGDCYGSRILFTVFDPDEDAIDWDLIDRTGNIVDLSDNLHSKIEDELLDLLISETPSEMRDGDDTISGIEIGKETKAKKDADNESEDEYQLDSDFEEEELNKIRENFNRLSNLI